MTPGLAMLQKYLLEGRVLRAPMFSAKSQDEILNHRCLDVFDTEYQRVFKELEEYTARAAIPDDELAAVNDIREAAYRTALAFCRSPELATAVCDDFELIGASLAAGFGDPWLNALWLSYRHGAIPHLELKPVEGSLVDLIDY